MKKETELFDEFIKRKGLRRTPQRTKIVDVILSVEAHVSVDELYNLVKKRDPSVGYTTVYRTMKLLSECGICEEADFGDGIIRYEHKYGHKHHDHLICTKCGQLIEVMKPEIEEMQNNLTKEHGFVPIRHKLQIFGMCRKCLSGSNK